MKYSYHKRKEKLTKIRKAPEKSFLKILTKAIVRAQMPVRFPVNGFQMMGKWTTRNLFGHYVTRVMPTLQPAGFNDACSNGFLCNMETNSHVLLREIMARGDDTLNYTKIVPKILCGTRAIGRNVDAKASKVMSNVNGLLCCCL